MFSNSVEKIKKFEKGGGNIFDGTLDSHLESLTKGVDLSAGRVEATDFNSKHSKVFYVTADWDQAKLWARNRANLRGGAPGVVEYKFKDTLESLKSRYSWHTLDNYVEWAEFVKACRNEEKIHPYDAVEGPYLVNPGRVKRGEQDPIADGHQIALCLQKIVQELQYITFNVIGDSA